MEGACIYSINENNIYYDILFMYKEYSEYPGKVLVYIYKYNNKVVIKEKKHITTRKLSESIPIDAEHILTHMKYNRDDDIMIELWKKQIYNKLIK
jgi:hypothetical protein|tara:strand:- start:1163 stop:1447 length:285 start_codon:yes stop_codon:yes gene_type:complete